MDSDRKVRDLRAKIFELSQKFDAEFENVIKSRKYRKVQDLNISFSDIEEYADERFDERIHTYGVDKTNDEALKEMAISLKNVEKLLSMKLKDIRKVRDREEFEDIVAEVQSAISSSLFMQRLPSDELKKRLEKLKYNPDVTRREYIRNLKKEIEQLQYERDAARGMLVINRDPQLKSLYDELEADDRILKDEIEYRRENEEVSLAYNSLCEAYQTLERIYSRYSDPNLSEEENEFLEKELDKIIPILYTHLSEKTRERVFSKEKGFNGAEIFKVLKEEIQDLAFEKNALNGIVDSKALRKDSFDIVKIVILAEIEKYDNSKDLKLLMEHEKMQHPEFKEFASKVRMKLLMQDLIGIYQKEANLKQIDERLRELSGKPQESLTNDETREKQRLSKERGQIKMDINKISQKTAEIRKLGTSLGIECIIDGSLDLNSEEAIKTIGIVQVDAAIKKQKDLVNERISKVLARYEIEEGLTPEEITERMVAKVEEIRSRSNDRIVNLRYKDRSHEESEKTTDSSESKKENKKGIEKTDDDAVIIRKMKVHDTQIQLDTIDDRYRQRVECGKVYRYVRGKSNDELNFIEEDLEAYIENPKKKLDQVLNGIRDRLIRELGSEKELEIFCDENDDKEFLEGLVSKNPLKRFKAKRDFMKKIELANNGNEGMAYASMALALNSEVLPNAIVGVMARTAQPYDRENDMKRYVKIKEKSGLFGLISREEGKIYQSRLLEADKRRERAKEAREDSYINVRSKTNGMVRPFEFAIEELEFELRPKQKNNKPRKNNHKKRDSRSKDEEIE